MEKEVRTILAENDNLILFGKVFKGFFVEGKQLTHIYLNEETDKIHYFSNDTEIFPTEQKKDAIFALTIDLF